MVVTHAQPAVFVQGNNRGTRTVTEGTDAIVRLATLPTEGTTGTFQDRNGTVPW